MSKYDKLKKRKEEAFSATKKPVGHRVEIADEIDRVSNVLYHAGDIISDLDDKFLRATKLNGTDISFLFLAVAIQCIRQYLLSNEKLRLEDQIVDGKVRMTSSQRGDKLMQTVYDSTLGQVAPPDWKKVLFQSVPYDAINTSNLFQYSTGLAGTTHRYRTLGHDPFLGWIFGVANIITSSLTKANFETYQVKDMVIMRRYPMGTPNMLRTASDYACKDPLLLAAAVSRQAVHLGSDYFTKQGLPVPFIASVNNDVAQKMLTQWHVDAWSITRGASVAAFINLLIAMIHKLFFSGGTEEDARIYEVRTRKILSYSNLIASSSNVLYVAATQNFQKLDVGGIAVALYRLITDYKFIQKIKQEFLENEWYNLVVGNEFEFMKGETT